MKILFMPLDPDTRSARGQHLRACREKYEAREGRRFSQRDAARFLGINENTYRAYEQGRAQLPEASAKALADLWGLATKDMYPRKSAGGGKLGTRETWTSVYNKPEQNDSGPAPESLDAALMVSDQRTIRVAVMVGEGSRVWSAKGAQRDTVETFAYLAAGRTLVNIGPEPLGHFRPGTVIVFQPSDYPKVGVYLLLSSRQDPDQRVIRVLDADRPTELTAEGTTPLPLGEWTVEGYAYAEIRDAKGVPEIDIRPAGIGPKR